MNNLQIFTLKALRKIAQKCGIFYVQSPLQREMNPDKASEMIYNLLMGDKPCMVARFGSTELSCIVNYLGISSKEHSIWKFIRGEQPEWWWNKNIMNQMQQWSGFFPPTEEKLTEFSKMMLEDVHQVDILGSWRTDENIVLGDDTVLKKVGLLCLEPYWSKEPWSRALAGKRVVVVHPFAELIEKQYREHRKELFKNPDVLPEFELCTVKAVQSLGGESNGFNDWFEALEWMKVEMEKEPYDIALIGCGAYGFPLAAHSKRTGHKAIHLGGALQLLFGIKGKRWENADYGCRGNGRRNLYAHELFNRHWIYPSNEYKPKTAENVENGCYW